MNEKTVPYGVKSLLESTYTQNVMSNVGDYAGLFRFMGSELVSSTDGVGTKVCIACDEHEDGDWRYPHWAHEVIGEDIVNHCVNDILVMGAKPLFFLNSFSYSSAMSSTFMPWVMRGMARAARAVEMPIISGETAHMKDFFQKDYYDVIGTIIGEVPPMSKLDKIRAYAGNKLIGIPSSGPHTNGYTLIRKIFCGPDTDGIARESWKHDRAGLGMSVREAVMQPHRCYYNLVKPMLDRHDIRTIAHITGGGIVPNLKRVIGEFRTMIDWTSWKMPRLFEIIKEFGNVEEEEMRSTFNLGIGMVLVVGGNSADKALNYLRTLGEDAKIIGDVF